MKRKSNSPIIWITVSETFGERIAGYFQLGNLQKPWKNKLQFPELKIAIYPVILVGSNRREGSLGEHERPELLLVVLILYATLWWQINDVESGLVSVHRVEDDL